MNTSAYKKMRVAARLAHSSAVFAIAAALLLFFGQYHSILKPTPAFAASPAGAIEGHRIDQNESLSALTATITIASTSVLNTFTDNPYTSGLIAIGTYTVTSSQPSGYSVSYSTNPTGGASTYVSGSVATVTVTEGQIVDVWWKYSPITGTSGIQGSKVDQNGVVSNFVSTITISGVGSFTDNSYNSGTIVPGTYTVTASQPSGYSVSYSTNPAGGASTYVSGSTATVTVAASQTVILWWKYSPITTITGAIRGSKVDQNGAVTSLGAAITISSVGSFTGNPYNSGPLGSGIYTVSSSQPSGYSVSYSTNPAGGASTYVSGSIAMVTVTAGQTIDLWWKYTPVTTSIQGYKVDQNNMISSAGAAITISSVGSFTDNPYNSGQINAGTYTVSSSQPSGYSVSYSTNPTGGASTYVSGSVATIAITAGQRVILWWKYTPITETTGTGSIQGSRVDQNGTVSSIASTITISSINSFTDNPYNSGQIQAATYTVSSSQPAGYNVSYSMNPSGGASTYVSGSIATVTVIAGQAVNLWWKYTPIIVPTTINTIGGFKVNQDGQVTTIANQAIITINGVGSFTDNPYNSGQIQAATYTVSSSQPAGYNVSYSMNPSGGASTYVSGSIATVTVIAGQAVNLWWKYTPLTGIIQGSKVGQSGEVVAAISATPITIYGVGTFTGNPYNSGQVPGGTYTISSAEPVGYSVSHSINPDGGASTYISGSTATVTIIGNQTINLWWRYTPIPRPGEFKLELDNLLSSYSPSVLTYKEIKRMWIGALTDNFFPAIHASPDLSIIPRASEIFYSEYINGSWTKPFPERTFKKSGFQINDPSVIKFPNIKSLIGMYYTALSNADAEQKIFDRHKIGFALSIDGGQSWQDKGIVMDYPESGDGKGASSPSAISVGDEMWVYYHTGTQDLSKPINWRVRFDINSFSTIKIGLPERLNFAGFIPGDPNWILSNLDVSYRNSQFVLLANTSDLKKVVRFVSDDGLNWRKPTSGPATMIEVTDGFALTPTTEDLSDSRYKIYFGLGSVSASRAVSTMIRSKEFDTSETPLPVPAYVFTDNISIGDTGNDVIALQSCLKKDSSLYPEGLVTGYFGPLTRRAVMRFQARQGLTSDGFVDDLTRSKLNEACSP